MPIVLRQDVVQRGAFCFNRVRTARDVQRADVNGACWSLPAPFLALASGENMPLAIAQLLRCCASPNVLPHDLSLGRHSALSFVTLNAASNPHALAVAGLLLHAREDIHFRGDPGRHFPRS